MPEILLARPVVEHVALGHQGEDLPRREKAVRQEELVVGAAAADPPPGHGAEAEASPRSPVERSEHEHGRRLPGQDRGHRLADHGARSDAAGADLAEVVEATQAERVDEVVVPNGVAVAAHDAVDVAGGQTGVGERGERRFGGQRQHAAARVSRELGGADAGDGAPVTVMERLGHQLPPRFVRLDGLAAPSTSAVCSPSCGARRCAARRRSGRSGTARPGTAPVARRRVPPRRRTPGPAGARRRAGRRAS